MAKVLPKKPVAAPWTPRVPMATAKRSKPIEGPIKPVAAPQPAMPTVAGPKAITPATGLAPAQVRDEDVMNQVNRVIASKSPLMKQAETAGLQQANRRGLLASTMAVGAAQDSVYKAATPIAAQTAAQNATANLQDRDIAAQHGLQAVDIAAERERFTAQIASNEKLSAKEIAANRETQLRDIQGRYGLQRKDAEAALKQIEAQSTATAKEAKLNRAVQMQLAQWNLSASDREQAAGMLSTFSNSYEVSLDAINRNENLKAEDRTKQIAALNARRQKQMGLVREMYDIDIKW